MLWAAETKKLVDVFIIFTDQPCGTFSSVATGDAVTPAKALHQYCNAMSRTNTRYDGVLNMTVTQTNNFLLYSGVNLNFHFILFSVYTNTNLCAS